MPEAVTFRAATPEDAAALAELATGAFVATFGYLYAPHDLSAFLSAERSVARYLAHLSDPSARIQVAELGGRLRAYALVLLGKGFEERPTPKPLRPAMLSQLYCANDATGHGIGSALMGWAIGEARTWRADAIQLSVFSENFGAQRFYQRFGFSHVADIDFWVGHHRDHEFLYELSLS